MSDTPELAVRLRRYRSIMVGGHPSICDEAADRIDALTAECETLRDRQCEGCGQYMPRYCATCTKDWQS